jgi:hypothetical protein
MWGKSVSSECLIPHRKENGWGVFKIEGKLPQLSFVG